MVPEEGHMLAHPPGPGLHGPSQEGGSQENEAGQPGGGVEEVADADEHLRRLEEQAPQLAGQKIGHRLGVGAEAREGVAQPPLHLEPMGGGGQEAGMEGDPQPAHRMAANPGHVDLAAPVHQPLGQEDAKELDRHPHGDLAVLRDEPLLHQRLGEFQPPQLQEVEGLGQEEDEGEMPAIGAGMGEQQAGTGPAFGGARLGHGGNSRLAARRAHTGARRPAPWVCAGSKPQPPPPALAPAHAPPRARRELGVEARQGGRGMLTRCR